MSPTLGISASAQVKMGGFGRSLLEWRLCFVGIKSSGTTPKDLNGIYAIQPDLSSDGRRAGFAEIIAVTEEGRWALGRNSMDDWPLGAQIDENRTPD